MKFKKIMIPKFDKSIDDRSSKSKWVKVNKKPNIVIFEGWCVGVEPQKKKDLIVPIIQLSVGLSMLSKLYHKLFQNVNHAEFLKCDIRF